MNHNQHNPTPIMYFPGTNQPVPAVLTEDELIRVLRLDLTGIKDPARCLKRYRERGLLKATQISRSYRYYVSDVLAFIEQLQESNPR